MNEKSMMEFKVDLSGRMASNKGWLEEDCGIGEIESNGRMIALVLKTTLEEGKTKKKAIFCH